MAEEEKADQQQTQILFVDDEANILSSLKRVFRKNKEYVCHFANSPREALEILAKHKIAVLVSDHRMPVMEGAEFLARVKDKRPSTVRIMLTGQASIDDVQTAVNSGEIYRFVLKPWDDDQLREIVADAVETYRENEQTTRQGILTESQLSELSRLKIDLEEVVGKRTEQLVDALTTAQSLNGLLEESLQGSTKVFFSLLELARPDLGGHCRRVAEHAVALGKALAMKQEDIAELEVAALLHDTGKLGMPAYMLSKSEADYTDPEREIYRMHPEVGAEHLQAITHFQNICNFIKRHHEKYDGSGFPEGLKGAAVPIQAYIIAICNTYDHLINRVSSDPQFNYNRTYQELSNKADREFPTHVVEAMLQHIEEKNRESLDDNAIRVGIRDLAPKMVLACHVYTMSGTLLISEGSQLTPQAISRIRSIAQVDPIAGEIYVTWAQNSRGAKSSVVV